MGRAPPISAARRGVAPAPAKYEREPPGRDRTGRDAPGPLLPPPLKERREPRRPPWQVGPTWGCGGAGARCVSGGGWAAGCAGPSRGNKGGLAAAAAPRNQARGRPAAAFLPSVPSLGLAPAGGPVSGGPRPGGCRDPLSPRGASPRPLCPASPCPRSTPGESCRVVPRLGCLREAGSSPGTPHGCLFIMFFPHSHGVQRQSGCSSAEARTR